ncbi:MAG: ABC transporter substrate-binding protein [Hyphomicrobiales bacterium]|nr:ABC transporter substrate-binding protein [Hyphomicrobiales bacterium]
MSDLDITIAMDRYDRHFPFFDGTVKAPAGIRYKALQVGQSDMLRDGTDRHGQMIHDKAFDVAEFSMSTFLMAKDRGLPLVGVPIFPRRLFSQSCMFVRENSDIEHPKDLIGRKVGISSFQTTLSLLAKGDIKFEYGVEWEKIKWVLTTNEKVKFTPKEGVVIERAEKGKDLGHMLDRGEIDAIFMPHPPSSVMTGEVRTRRLFRDSMAEEKRYFDKYGYWPIMHIMAMHKDLADREPQLAQAIMEMYVQARHIADEYFLDPNWSQMAWGRRYYESEREKLPNRWRDGFKGNRKNLERFILYSHDQGLISEQYEPERLFLESTLDT